MPTRIFFANGEQVTVSDEPEAVAQALGAGGLAKLDRPWGDSAIYVNPTTVLYVESQDERSPDIEAMEATSPPAASAPSSAAPPVDQSRPAPGMPGGPPVQPPPRP